VRTEHGSLVLLSQISSGGVGERAHHCLGRDRTAAVRAAEAPERRWRPLGTRQTAIALVAVGCVEQERPTTASTPALIGT
jgi:hypothetical protein